MVIAPFNFPAMIPFWFFPYAIACGNTCIVKPSEKVPLTMSRVFEFIGQTGLPKGILNLVNGAAGKRAQCHGGAKNAVVVLPDCDFEMSTRIIADSALAA